MDIYKISIPSPPTTRKHNIHGVPFWAHHLQTANTAIQSTYMYGGLPARQFEGTKIYNVENVNKIFKFISPEL